MQYSSMASKRRFGSDANDHDANGNDNASDIDNDIDNALSDSEFSRSMAPSPKRWTDTFDSERSRSRAHSPKRAAETSDSERSRSSAPSPKRATVISDPVGDSQSLDLDLCRPKPTASAMVVLSDWDSEDLSRPKPKASAMLACLKSKAPAPTLAAPVQPKSSAMLACLKSKAIASKAFSKAALQTAVQWPEI